MLQGLWIVTRTCPASGVQENSKSDASSIQYRMVPTLQELLRAFLLIAGSCHAAACASSQAVVWEPMHF